MHCASLTRDVRIGRSSPPRASVATTQNALCSNGKLALDAHHGDDDQGGRRGHRGIPGEHVARPRRSQRRDSSHRPTLVFSRCAQRARDPRRTGGRSWALRLEDAAACQAATRANSVGSGVDPGRTACQRRATLTTYAPTYAAVARASTQKLGGSAGATKLTTRPSAMAPAAIAEDSAIATNGRSVSRCAAPPGRGQQAEQQQRADRLGGLGGGQRRPAPGSRRRAAGPGPRGPRPPPRRCWRTAAAGRSPPIATMIPPPMAAATTASRGARGRRSSRRARWSRRCRCCCCGAVV